MILRCQCCGFEQSFHSEQAAFDAGWDAPPHFTGYVCCNICPGSFVVLGITHRHEKAHRRWEIEGRPKEFQVPEED